jgi:signal transduction histidine kinase
MFHKSLINIYFNIHVMLNQSLKKFFIYRKTANSSVHTTAIPGRFWEKHTPGPFLRGYKAMARNYIASVGFLVSATGVAFLHLHFFQIRKVDPRDIAIEGALVLLLLLWFVAVQRLEEERYLLIPLSLGTYTYFLGAFSILMDEFVEAPVYPMRYIEGSLILFGTVLIGWGIIRLMETDRKGEVEREELRQRRFHWDKLSVIGKFAALFIHEVSSPLTTISLIAGNLRGEKGSPEVQGEKILLQVATLEKFISSLRVFAETGEYKMEREKINVADLLNESLEQNLLGDEDIHVVKDIVPTEFMGDRILLTCSFRIIIKNALDAMPDGGTLKVVAKPKDDNLTVAISDTGGGIPQENLDMIFEPFYTTKDGEGVGLGLFIAHGIIEQHEGAIAVESEAGRGTTIRVILPRGGG